MSATGHQLRRRRQREAEQVDAEKTLSKEKKETVKADKSKQEEKTTK